MFSFFFSGSELLYQDSFGGLTIVNVAKNTSKVFMSNSTFVSNDFECEKYAEILHKNHEC